MFIADCYDGAYGLTIRVDAASLDDVRALREVFRRLSEGEVREVELLGLGALTARNLRSDTLALANSEPRVSLGQLEEGVFSWVHTKYGWETCGCLIDPLIEANAPGHQYLTDEGVDEALVEVCLYEGPDARRTC